MPQWVGGWKQFIGKERKEDWSKIALGPGESQQLLQNSRSPDSVVWSGVLQVKAKGV